MYEMDFISLFAAMFPSLRSLRDFRDNIFTKLYSTLHNYKIINNNSLSPADWQFCSELVATIYKEFDIIPNTVNPKDVVPIDFFGCDEDGLPLIVHPPIFIKDWTIEGSPAIEYKIKH